MREERVRGGGMWAVCAGRPLRPGRVPSRTSIRFCASSAMSSSSSSKSSAPPFVTMYSRSAQSSDPPSGSPIVESASDTCRERWRRGGGREVEVDVVAVVEVELAAVVVWWWQWRRVGHLAEARAQLGLGLEVGVQRAVEEGEDLQRGEGGGGGERWRWWQWWQWWRRRR